MGRSLQDTIVGHLNGLGIYDFPEELPVSGPKVIENRTAIFVGR
jgi:hypothetical protein